MTLLEWCEARSNDMADMRKHGGGSATDWDDFERRESKLKRIIRALNGR
jgi:hypothetical protein